jgi:hypothetical protein
MESVAIHMVCSSQDHCTHTVLVALLFEVFRLSHAGGGHTGTSL